MLGGNGFLGGTRTASNLPLTMFLAQQVKQDFNCMRACS